MSSLGLNNHGIPAEVWAGMSAQDRQKVFRRAWREKNREKVRADNRAYKKAHPKLRSGSSSSPEYKRQWRLKNRDRINEARRHRLATDAEFRARHYEIIKRSKEKRRKITNTYPAFGEMIHRELMKVDVYAIARKALPSGLPAFTRDDVITDIVLATLEGKLAVQDIAAKTKDFLRAHYRMFDQWKTVSLDAPIPRMDGATYLDRLAMEPAE